jgi:hypothetical protein
MSSFWQNSFQGKKSNYSSENADSLSFMAYLLSPLQQKSITNEKLFSLFHIKLFDHVPAFFAEGHRT